MPIRRWCRRHAVLPNRYVSIGMKGRVVPNNQIMRRIPAQKIGKVHRVSLCHEAVHQASTS
jgi:hypothetical protein